MTRPRRRALSRTSHSRRRSKGACSAITLSVALLGLASIAFLALQLINNPAQRGSAAILGRMPENAPPTVGRPLQAGGAPVVSNGGQVGAQPGPIQAGGQPAGTPQAGVPPAGAQQVGAQPVAPQQVGVPLIAQKPVVQQPVVQKPVVQQPVMQQPAMQQPVAQQPVMQQPVAQHPVVQQPVVQQPVVQQHVVQQPVAQQSLTRPLSAQQVVAPAAPHVATNAVQQATSAVLPQSAPRQAITQALTGAPSALRSASSSGAVPTGVLSRPVLPSIGTAPPTTAPNGGAGLGSTAIGAAVKSPQTVADVTQRAPPTEPLSTLTNTGNEAVAAPNANVANTKPTSVNDTMIENSTDGEMRVEEEKSEGNDGMEDSGIEDETTSTLTRAGTSDVNHTSIEVLHGNDLLRIPRGSRVTGKLPEFLGVKSAYGGLVRGQNITRVSYALYKIVKLFGFRSMIDSPAGLHADWMPETLQRIEFDKPEFKYWGIDTNCTVLQAVRNAVGASANSEYKCGDDLPREVDVIFHWTDLDGTATDPRSQMYPAHVEQILKNAKAANATYIIFGQYPRIKERTVVYRYGKWVFKEDPGDRPFLLNDHIRGVVPVMDSKDPYMLYMTFYSVRALHLAS